MTTLRNLQISSARTTALFFGATSVLTFAALAQNEGNQTPPPTKPNPSSTIVEYTSIERMVGAPVFLQASAEAVAEATREGEKADRPKAKVTEWIVDCRDGKLCHAVVSIGGFLGIGDKTVLVPANELTWNNSMERYDLGWTKDQLKAKPAFDLSAAEKSGLDAACGTIVKDANGAVVKDASGKIEKVPADASTANADRMITGTTFQRCETCACKASDLAKMPVYAGATEWGKVRDLVVDRAKGKVVLAIVNHGATLGVGGNEYLVAYPRFTMAVKDGDNRLLCAKEVTPAQLESSVKFEKPKNGVVEPEAAKRALAQTPSKS
jgi:sporulation protein YlmC with PRC-barrel domain